MHMDIKADATESSYPRNFFCEIVTSTAIQIPELLHARVNENAPDAQAELQRLALERRDELVNAADLIAGLIGLRLHLQFLKKLVNENDIALRPGNPIT